MGILNIVFGSLFLLCNLCVGVVLLVAVGGSAQGGLFGPAENPFPDMWNFMKAEVPAFAALTIGEVIANVLLSGCLIVAGIGLLGVQAWARALSIAYSVLTILTKIGSLIFTLAVVNPATARWEQDYLRRHGLIGQASATGDAAFNNLLSVIGAVIGMAYAIVLLIMMLLPSVSASFAGREPAREYDLDRGDEDEDDLGHERRRREGWDE
jgi:hypothetical protein